jgi:hypothetical protein
MNPDSYGLAGSFVMLYDRTSGITANVSKNFDGTPGFGTDYALAANSTAAWRNISSLVGIDNDRNGSCDQSCLFNTIYARKPATGNQPAIPISVAVGGGPENGGSGDTVISGNGRFVAFYSGSTNMIPETLGCCGHIFLRDTLSGTTELISVAPNGNALSASPLSLSMSQNGCALAFSSDRLYIRFRGGDCPTLPPPPTDCTVIGGFKVAEGICGKDQGSIKLAVADLTNPDVKVALATEVVSQTAGLFHLHTVEDLVLHNTPVGANGVARHNYVAINGTAFQRGCNLVNLSCESTGAASIFGLNGWIYGTKGGGRGDASKLDTTNPSFFSFAASRTATIHRRREPKSGNIGDFNQGDTTYITNAIMGADFAVGFGRLILDDTYIAGDDAYGAKTAVGVSKDGKRVFIAVGGFFTSSKELADSLKVVGAYRAVLLDGGGSPQITSVVAEGQDLEYYVSYRIITRSVINGIVLYNAASRTSIDTALTTSGGTFTLGPGVTATFAPNTFISTTTLSYAPIATPNDDSYVSLDRAFRLTAQGTATAAVRNGASSIVNRAYTLTVSYDQRLLPATMSAASFGIYTLTETGWHREPTSAVNQSAHTITAQINHFGDFAVLSPRPEVVYLPLTIR